MADQDRQFTAEQLQYLSDAVAARGLVHTARAIGIHYASLKSLLDGHKLRNGTVAIIRQSLAELTAKPRSKRSA